MPPNTEVHGVDPVPIENEEKATDPYDDDDAPDQAFDGKESPTASVTLIEPPRDFAWNKPGKPYDQIKGKLVAPGFATFELNIDKAVAEQLGRLFDSVETVELTLEKIRNIPPKSAGVYALYRQDELWYVGKADSKKGLAGRLTRHRRKLMNRAGISASEIKFKACLIYSFAAIDVETILIRLAVRKKQIDDDEERTKAANDHRIALKAWKKAGGEVVSGVPQPVNLAGKKSKAKPPALNNSGFGSNDTGKERDSQKTSRFDTAHPLELASVVNAFDSATEFSDIRRHLPDMAEDGTCPLLEAVVWFSEAVYFTCRISKGARSLLARQEKIKVDPRTLFAKDSMSACLKKVSLSLAGLKILVLEGRVLIVESDDAGLKIAHVCFENGTQTSVATQPGSPQSAANLAAQDGHPHEGTA